MTATDSQSRSRSILHDCLAVLSSSHLASLCGVVTSVAIRSVLGPAVMGVWSAIRTILEYASYSGFGASRAANVGIAVAHGRRDDASGARLADAGMTIELIGVLPVVVGLLAAAAYCARTRGVDWTIGLSGAALLAVLGRYHSFCLTVLRARMQFSITAKARVLGAGTEIGLMAGGAALAGIGGLVAGAAISQALNLVYVCRRAPLRLGWLWDRSLAGELVRDGWPMAASALALSGIRSVDRLCLVALRPNGELELGLYSAALLISAWAYDQANLIANVVFPRLGAALGQTGDASRVVRLGLQASERLAWVMVISSAGLLLAGIPVAAWLLPEYRVGLSAAYGSVAAASLLGVSMPLRHTLVTLGRTHALLCANGLALSVAVVSSVTVVAGGGSLGHLAWASAASAGICLVQLIALVAGPIAARDRTRFAGATRVLLASAYLLASIVAMSLDGHSLVSRWLTALAACVPVLFWASAVLWPRTRVSAVVACVAQAAPRESSSDVAGDTVRKGAA